MTVIITVTALPKFCRTWKHPCWIKVDVQISPSDGQIGPKDWTDLATSVHDHFDLRSICTSTSVLRLFGPKGVAKAEVLDFSFITIIAFSQHCKFYVKKHHWNVCNFAQSRSKCALNRHVSSSLARSCQEPLQTADKLLFMTIFMDHFRCQVTFRREEVG